MSKNNKIILIIAIVLLFVLVFVLLFWQPWKKGVDVEPVVPPITEDDKINGGQTTTEPLGVGTEDFETTPDTTARIFAERYGSFSNESYFQNLRDLFPLMSQTMQDKTQGYIDSNTVGDDVLSYYGVSTRVLSVSVTEQGDTAEITVKTQREETVGGPYNTSVRYQDLELIMIKIGNDWKIDTATWL